MKSQDKSIETLKIKAVLEVLVEKYGFDRVEEVLDKMRKGELR